MKYWLFLLIILLGCAQNEDKAYSSMDRFMSDNGKLKVLATTGVINDLVSQIGGEYIDPVALITGELDPHSYELVKGDDEKFCFAQVVFYNGLGLEHGASLHYRLENHPGAISLGGEIRRVHPEALIYVDKEVDPHIWMDIALWTRTIDLVVNALSAQDKEHAAIFKQNGEIVRAHMLDIDRRIQALMQQIAPEKRYLVTSHDAFNYFTKRYLALDGEAWRMRCAAPEGLSPEGQLSTVHISRIIDHLAQYHIRVIFPESNVSRDSLNKIALACREKGIAVRVSKEVLYGDAMGGQGSGAESYLQMVEHNAAVLFKEWQ